MNHLRAPCQLARSVFRRLNATPNSFTKPTVSNYGTASHPTFRLEKLKGRSLIRVHGPQARDFLQSLITNDINRLHGSTVGDGSATSLYTMFLNKGGRVLYDAIIYKPKAGEETYLVECDRQIETELQSHMKVFRVRKKIDIDIVSNERSVWVAFNPDVATKSDAPKTLEREEFHNDLLITADPRLNDLGTRIVAPAEWSGAGMRLKMAAEDDHRLHRYRLGIGEGVTELPVAKCFPFESNCDFLQGVSFQKGCYLGQELTARTYHTGVVRKRLLPIEFIKGQLTRNSSRHVESTHGTVLGKVRGFQSEAGLALLKYEAALKEDSALVFGGANDGGVTGRPFKPNWWPRDMPKR